MDRKLRVAALATLCCLSTLPLVAQTPPKPATQKPRTSQPKPKPAAPAVKPAAPEAKPPAPAPPQDVRFRTTYTTEGLKTETLTYIKGVRERYEFQDMLLLKQPDEKRTIQISLAAKTYLIIPDGASSAPAPQARAPVPPKPPGVIKVATTITDTGERKTMFGRQARHVKTTIEKQPLPGACDATTQRIETDGWYIDSPTAPVAPAAAAPAPPGECADEVQTAVNGDPKVLGFPIAYSSTVTGADGKPVVASMDVSEYEVTTLDPALFEIPPGLAGASDMRALSKALSDASEVKLAEADAAPPASPAPRAPGAIRIGVPEVGNKTAQSVDTRALRQRLVAALSDGKSEAVPMAAASPAELQKRAQELGYDYLLLAEVTELKVSKPGKFGGLMQAASGVAGAAGAATAASGSQEKTESTIAVKLVQPDGKQRLSTTGKGKDGSGFTLSQGLGLAKFAGGMYLSFFTGPQMFARLQGLGTADLGGMGLLGNPMLYKMQAGGLAGAGNGIGIDHTAGAASYLVQQAMAMNASGGLVGTPGQGPSYDESLGEAVQNVAKSVHRAIQKK